MAVDRVSVLSGAQKACVAGATGLCGGNAVEAVVAAVATTTIVHAEMWRAEMAASDREAVAAAGGDGDDNSCSISGDDGIGGPVHARETRTSELVALVAKNQSVQGAVPTEFSAEEVGTAESGLNTVALSPTDSENHRSHIRAYLDHHACGTSHWKATTGMLKTLREEMQGRVLAWRLLH
ncbi:hypothetical protein HU200_040280 [Digitaria exilis]|uniref:Uncharacterized protein n=1 Tax=Digitaria exilis TaxID=1010633 RepID=A0A835B7E5_9POAL|nr:hypothetical protein HU200_040280 [Digitaria exilis]